MTINHSPPSQSTPSRHQPITPESEFGSGSESELGFTGTTFSTEFGSGTESEYESYGSSWYKLGSESGIAGAVGLGLADSPGRISVMRESERERQRDRERERERERERGEEEKMLL